MKTFNLTAYSNGRIVKTIKADTLQEAQEKLETQGYDCQDDHFLETIEQSSYNDSLYGRSIYIDEEY